MVFNPFKKKDDFVDLSEHFRKQQALEKRREESVKADEGDLRKSFYPGLAPKNSSEEEPAKEPVAPMFGLFNSESEPKEEVHSENNFIGTSQDDAPEKRRKLAKRLIDMTTKVEDLSNQVYSLQQRIEVLERKSGVGN